MSAIAFDTLRFSKRLRSGGYTEEQADALAEAYAEAVSDGVASKSDLQLAAEKANGELHKVGAQLDTKVDAVAARLDAKIDKVAADLDAAVTTLRGEIQYLAKELRIEIRDSKISLIKWFVPMMMGQTAVTVALIKLL